MSKMPTIKILAAALGVGLLLAVFTDLLLDAALVLALLIS
jgi:hypothetical protein